MPWPDMGAAFANKGDRRRRRWSSRSPPNMTNAPLAFPFARAADILHDPPLEVSVILYGKSWIDRSPDQVRAFAVAYLEGVRDYYDAMRGGPLRAEIIDILAKYTPLKDKALYDRIAWSYMDPNAELSIASLIDQQEWYARSGEIEHKVDVAAMIDRRFLDYALSKLGRVEAR